MAPTVDLRSAASRLVSSIAVTVCFCGLSVTAQGDCPNPAALDLLRHEFAYQRTEELDRLKGLTLVHADVWERGPNTAFYIREHLAGFLPAVRLGYLFDAGGLVEYFTCTDLDEWKTCVQKFAPPTGSGGQPQTCMTTINLRDIPPWEPSPDSPAKRKVAGELLAEIDASWPGAREIVVRDFNLEDPQITMYLKMPDGDYFQGCGLHAATQPHCVGWHSFGMVPDSKIRQRVFEKPYRLR